MSPNAAYLTIKDEFPNREFYTCVEFESMFVFSSTDPNGDSMKTPIAPPIAIDKYTYAINVFNPMKMSVEEYRNGKNIEFFK